MLRELLTITVYLSNQIHLGNEMIGLKAARFLARTVGVNLKMEGVPIIGTFEQTSIYGQKHLHFTWESLRVFHR